MTAPRAPVPTGPFSGLRHHILPGLLLLGVVVLGGCDDTGCGTLPLWERAWKGAILLENGTEAAANPQIALDTLGNALAVWQQYDPGTTNYSIYTTRYSASNRTWSGASLLENAPGNANGPQIALDLQGNAVVVWQQHDGTDTSIYANRYSASSGTWSGASLLENATGAAGNAQIALDPLGNAVAVWVQHDGIADSIYVNRYSATSNQWSGASPLETAAGAAQNPQVAFDTQGNAVAVWAQHDGTTTSIYINRYNASSGAWSGASPLETAAGAAQNPQVAFDTQGNAVVVWMQHDGTTTNIYANRHSATSNQWSGATLLKTGAGAAQDPQITLDPQGNAVVVWQQNDPSIDNSNIYAVTVWQQNDPVTYNYSIYTNRYNASSGTWSGAILLETGTAGAQNPQVAIDPQGNAVVVWQRKDAGTTNSNIHASRYSAINGAWRGTSLLETGAGDAVSPQVALDPQGNAVAVWAQYDGTTTSIYANRLE